MNTILFPTDFSNNALNALDYTIELVNSFECKLVMIHVVNVSSKAGTLQVLERQLVEDAEKELENWVARAKNKLHNPDAIIAKVVKGKVSKRVETISKQFEVDLVVISAKGEGDKDNRYLGKVSAGLVKKTNIPILIVPKSYRFQSIKNIVFSLKRKRVASPRVVEPLKEIAKKFGASVALLHVKTPDHDPSKGDNLYMDELPFETFTLESKYIFDETKVFVEDNPIDLLVAIRRKRGFFRNIIFKKGTKKKIFNPEVPFLILQGKK